MFFKEHKTIKSLLGVIIISLAMFACSDSLRSSSIRGEMRDAYQKTSKLYTYVWNPPQFNDPINETEIKSLLIQLAEDFHRVQQVSEADVNSEASDPGFQVTLLTQQEQIRDIRARFDDGSKDYANWRLRGLTSNCVACHSRHTISSDFFGKLPDSIDDSYDSKFAAAQFLFASRQFEKASDSFLKLAMDSTQGEGRSRKTLRALKHWLVIQVRVKDRNQNAAEELKEFIEKSNLPAKDQQLLRVWMRDLRSLAKDEIRAEQLRQNNSLPDQSLPLALPRASNLLKQVENGNRIDDEVNLVKTLYASGILHQYLTKSELIESKESRRQATYLLALAYLHLPLITYDVYREMYLELCIRQFPNTREAQEAFKLYQEYVEVTHTGTGGMHLDPDEKKKIEELRTVAFSLPANSSVN